LEGAKMVTPIEFKSEEEINYTEKSSLPQAFYILGVLLLLFGSVGGAGFGTIGESLGGFNLVISTIVWVASIFTAMTFFWFGKVIELLVKIYNK
jgi:hypothetical protein